VFLKIIGLYQSSISHFLFHISMLRRLQQIQQEGYTVDISGIINSAWELLKSQLGIFILFNLLAMVVVAIVQMIIPIASIATTPFVVLANCHAFRECEQGKTVEFATFFEVFNLPNFGNTIIAYLIMALISIGVILGICFVFGGVAGISMLAFGGFEDIENNASAMMVVGLIAVIAFLVLCAAMIYISCVYSLIMPTVFFATDGTGWWELMEASRKALARNWGMLFLLNIVMGFLVLLGTIFTLGFGLLVLIPLVYAINYVTFREIIGFESGNQVDKDITQHFVL
jgi:hypothetical protein